MTSTTQAPDRPTTPNRRRMGVEERREQLIGVALDLFGRRTPDEVSLDEIASAAGISRPLLYHYFPGGKLGLYEAALGRAADELAGLFDEPQEGALGLRLARGVHRYFDFVAAHGPGFAALLRGGPAAGAAAGAGTPADGPAGAGALAPGDPGRTLALIEGVRQAARTQVLAHLTPYCSGPPPVRLELLVRSWVMLSESTAQQWLDGVPVERAELERRLVHDFAALAAVGALHDPELAAVVRRVLDAEPADSPFRELPAGLAALAG
ncbi:TetR/AcrR family transcriptional regulator [Streptomyces sp. NPDC060194]|uniref:TetR/AcrR family transcriptional regulator n=1 Tax=Streptomyces sp. NPDC060194 TaxID=3347069 RepID=UPI00364AA377